MKITVFGAANEVTGSCYLIEADGKHFLVDCGLFQGSEKLERLNYIPKALNAHQVSAIILTHGHLDHCGRIPLLHKEGFSGVIYCTEPTAQIAKLVMTDAAKIQEEDVARENKHRKEQRLPPLDPLYTVQDVEAASKLIEPVPYGKPVSISDKISFKLVEAGHILGSSSVELTIIEDDGVKELVFSGDIGQWNAPILQDPSTIDQRVNVVFMESTYGERNHRELEQTVSEFQEAIKETVAKGGKVLIPTFAVGRAQMILFYLAQMFRNHVIPPVPVYLDSPMAIAATEIYDRYVPYMDDEARDLHSSGELRRDLETLKLSVTVDDSKAINEVEGACIILAGSGMCNAGRILHHMRHNLGDAANMVLIVGYQPKGSLGRLLVEGAKTVKISGETVVVRATTKGLGGFSAHAGQTDLLRWLQPMAKSNPRVVLVHGEPHAMDQLSFCISDRFGIKTEKPKLGEVLTV